MRINIAIMVFDDVEVLDFAGPFEVFAVADELRGYKDFNVFTVAPRPGKIRARNGLCVVPDHDFASCPKVDLLVVPGGFGTRALLKDSVTIAWIQERARVAAVTLSVCTGALLLARAGLLGGLRVTTHHELLEMLRRMEPTAIVDPGARFHDNGAVVTAAGISAGIDASLHLVGRLLGPDAASATARYMEYGPGR